MAGGLKKWFGRNGGSGWIDCKTSRPGKLRPCGRSSGEKRRGYPACRPTLSACSASKRRKRGPKRISWARRTKK